MNRRRPIPSVRLVAAFALLAIAAGGCRQDMHDQPRIEPLEAHPFFADGQGARPIPAGTVARGLLREDTHLWEGKDAAGELVDALPAGIELDRAILERGRDRYEIFCSVCHDSVGGGRGMIVRRGFKQPPPLYEDRLRAMPLGYFYDVINSGYGVMSSYAHYLPVEDRWAIAAYVRALQLRPAIRLDELPADRRQAFHDALASAAADPDGDHGDDHEEGHHP